MSDSIDITFDPTARSGGSGVGGPTPDNPLRGMAPPSLAATCAKIAPWRGGLLTHLTVSGDELLYLDEATFLDPSKNVRGGCPILFPSPGKLEGDVWSRGGRTGSMKQHGFARNLPWEVASASPSSVSLRLVSSAQTREQYPWDFEANFTFTALADGVRIDQTIRNTSPEAMPFGAGFHPYFAVAEADKALAKIPTGATRAFDNTTKQSRDLAAIDLTANEVDLHLEHHGSTRAELVRPSRSTIVVEGSEVYSRWVVWTLRGNDFVCLEPWTCPGNALNTGEGLITLAPDAAIDLWITIRAR